MGYKRHNGFTLVELIMTMVIITILSVGGAYILIKMVQSAIYIPNKLNMDMLASNAMDLMTEGDVQVKGLRFSRSITAIAPYQVTFNNQDDQVIQYNLNTIENKLYRSIDGGPDVIIPTYASAVEISQSGKNGQLFLYYDANDVITGDAADVRRIMISIIMMTGSGEFSQWQGKADLSSAIAVNQF